MHKVAALASLAALASPSMAQYTLKDDYEPSGFFDMFTFFTDSDPTHGFVNYVGRDAASSAGLISSGNTVHMGADSSNVATSPGRNSVRIQSNNAYDHGLYVLDLNHMPEGCGTWPAYWSIGPNWPSNGEIDIIEGVNAQVGNAMTLHTSSGCTAAGTTGFSGSVTSTNCDVNAPNQSANQGCGISSSDPTTYGSGLNSNGGGVYATEWNSNQITHWFWPHGSVPSDISSGSPTPGDSWGTPLASWTSGCDIDTYFHQQQIVFDLTFCGDWAGNVWSSGSCASQADTCQDYVANNPGAFANAYWDINSLKVYQDSSAATAATSGSSRSGVVDITGQTYTEQSSGNATRPVAFRF